MYVTSLWLKLLTKANMFAINKDYFLTLLIVISIANSKCRTNVDTITQFY